MNNEMDSEVQCATKSEFYEAIQKLYESGVIFTAYTDSLTITVRNEGVMYGYGYLVYCAEV